jgi:hypothetical protein
LQYTNRVVVERLSYLPLPAKLTRKSATVEV